MRLDMTPITFDIELRDIHTKSINHHSKLAIDYTITPHESCSVKTRFQRIAIRGQLSGCQTPNLSHDGELLLLLLLQQFQKQNRKLELLVGKLIGKLHKLKRKYIHLYSMHLNLNQLISLRLQQM